MHIIMAITPIHSITVVCFMLLVTHKYVHKARYPCQHQSRHWNVTFCSLSIPNPMIHQIKTENSTIWKSLNFSHISMSIIVLYHQREYYHEERIFIDFGLRPQASSKLVVRLITQYKVSLVISMLLSMKHSPFQPWLGNSVFPNWSCQTWKFLLEHTHYLG